MEDKATGKEQQIRIQASGGLSEEEIQKMLKDAEANAAEDAKRKEIIEVKNHAETLINTTEKGLADYGDKVSADEKAKIEADLNALKEAIKTDNKDDIQAKSQALMQSSIKIGEMMYKDMQTNNSASPNNSEKPDDGVVDGDFKDLNK